MKIVMNEIYKLNRNMGEPIAESGCIPDPLNLFVKTIVGIIFM